MKLIEFNSGDELKRIEKVSPKVSDKYIPVFSSEIISNLTPEFTFRYARQFGKGCSSHYVELINSNSDIIRIFNSYDRSRALSVYLISDGFGIDLGIDRLIHIGKKAKDFNTSIQDAKEEIIENINTAKIISIKLESEKITQELGKEISNIIYANDIKRKGFQSYTNYVDHLIPDISIKRYITMSIKEFMDGEYTYLLDGKKRNGRRKTSIFNKIFTENKIIKLLKEKYPEYFL